MNISRGFIWVVFAFAVVARDSAFALDLDGDGVSDVYMKHYGIAPVTAENDDDGDGFSTARESIFGTDPTEAESRPALEVSVAGGVATLRWSTVKGISYQIQSSSNLTDWTDDGSPVAGGGVTAEVTRASAASRLFYRLNASHGPDNDGDGLDLYEELLLGTDPNLADTDGDGINDGDEFTNGTAPANPDSDGDGISDGEERNRGTDPNDAGDGFAPTPHLPSLTNRLSYMGTWPNYPISPPPLPTIRLSLTDIETGIETAFINEAGAITTGAQPRGLYSGYSSRAQPDPVLIPGKEYLMQMLFSGTALWGDVMGRLFTNSGLNPDGDPINIIIYSTRTNGGSYYYSNPTGGVWHETKWQATGAPSNTVANSINFPVASRTASSASLKVVLFDLDVDSDNDSGVGSPDQSRDEDRAEDTEAKFIQLNDNSDNDNDVPDMSESQVANERDLVPLILDVGPKTLEWAKVKVKFIFPDTEIKIWNVVKPSDPKDPAKQILANTEYTADQLGLDASNLKLRFLIEGIALSTADQTIKASFIFNGVAFGSEDSVKVHVGKYRIKLATGQPDEVGGELPSRTGIKGLRHFITPKLAGGDVKFQAETDQPWDPSLYKWDISGTATAANDIVTVPRTDVGKVDIQLKYVPSGKTVDRILVWVFWADVVGNGIMESSTKSSYVNNGLRVPSSIGHIFVFTLTPFTVIQNIEIPNFAAPLVPKTFPPTLINGTDVPALQGGATTRLDISQRLAIMWRDPSPTNIALSDLRFPNFAKMQMPANPLPSKQVELLRFPSDPTAGNDDWRDTDEWNSPYASGKVKFDGLEIQKGEIASGDTPTAPGVLVTAGVVGEAFAASLKFQTFVRLQVGLTPKTAHWINVSDNINWLAVQKFVRKPAGVDDNGSTFYADHANY